MHQNRINESSNMLHYSNASSREKEYAISGDQGGRLAWKLSREGGVINTVVELGVAGSLRVYRKEVTVGEHNK